MNEHKCVKSHAKYYVIWNKFKFSFEKQLLNKSQSAGKQKADLSAKR